MYVVGLCSSSRHLPTQLLQLSDMHTAARLIKDLSHRDPIKPTLKQLHWFPIHARIALKISFLMCMYRIRPGTSPSYMLTMVSHALLPGPEDSDHPRVRILL